MRNVVIVDGVRTGFGKLGGGLRQFSMSELAAFAIDGLLDKTQLLEKGGKVDGVYLGCALHDHQTGGPARLAVLRSKLGYGDDFNFTKAKRMNRIISQHSQGRLINLLPKNYVSYSFDEIKENFITKNVDFFKAVYFDFAPVLAIPVYQERPVHSLKPIPDYSQLYSLKECEVLTNAVDYQYVVHPSTKTKAILKSHFVTSKDKVDETCITAYSYDIEQRVDYVPVLGGDGNYHDVPVYWDEYLPLVAQNHFYISTNEIAGNKSVIATHNGLCIFKS